MSTRDDLINNFIKGAATEQQLRQDGVSAKAIADAKKIKKQLASTASSSRKVGGDLASSNDGIKDLLGT